MESRLPVEDMIQRGLLSRFSRLVTRRAGRQHHSLQPSTDAGAQDEGGLGEPQSAAETADVRSGAAKHPVYASLLSLSLANPQLTSSLRAKAGDLEMKMKRKMMEKRLFQRPTPRELQQNHPGVYNSLSEEAKQAESSFEGDTILRVFVSFLEATAEQLLRSEKVGMRGVV